jgi:hypothetical protein
MGVDSPVVVRPRWQEWVIIGALVAIGLTGVAAIWGDDLVALWTDVSRAGEDVAPEPPAEPQPIAPPAGPPI